MSDSSCTRAKRGIAAALALFCLAVAAPGALATQAPEALADWREDGRIDGDYTADELAEARDAADATELEYSSLSAELDRALAADAGDGSESEAGGMPLAAWLAVGVLAVAGIEGIRRLRRHRRK